MKKSTCFGIIISIAIALILASRDLYIAPDDENYINYFTYSNIALSDAKSDWWNFLLNEPLWSTYSWLTGDAFGAETALRITVFISSLMFLVASGKLSHGAWLFIIFVFVIDPLLATQMYFNQMRQGFSLAIFLTIIAGGLNPILAGVIASLFHSSFLIATPCIALAWGIKKFNIHYIFGVITALLAALIISKVVPEIDFGRRSNYELKSEFTIFHFIGSVFQYGLVLLFFLSKKDTYGEGQLFWLYASVIYFVFVTCLTFIHEAAGRLLSLENVFLMIIIGMNLKTKEVKIIALFWLLILFALEVNQSQKVSSVNNALLDRWSLILKIR
jgi:EpsG family